MSQENVHIVLQLFDAAAKRELAKLPAFLTPDTLWTTTYAPPLDGEYRGPQAAIEFMSLLAASFDASHVELQHVVAQGDIVVLIIREKLLAKKTGKSAINNAVITATLREGLVAAVRIFGDSHAVHEILQPA